MLAPQALDHKARDEARDLVWSTQESRSLETSHLCLTLQSYNYHGPQLHGWYQGNQ
jgi:hypothetical protein